MVLVWMLGAVSLMCLLGVAYLVGRARGSASMKFYLMWGNHATAALLARTLHDMREGRMDDAEARLSMLIKAWECAWATYKTDLPDAWRAKIDTAPSDAVLRQYQEEVHRRPEQSNGANE